MPIPALLTDPKFANSRLGIASALLSSGGWTDKPTSNAQMMGSAIQGYQQGREQDRWEAMRQQMPALLQDAPVSLIQQILSSQFDPRTQLAVAEFQNTKAQQKQAQKNFELQRDIEKQHHQDDMEMRMLEYKRQEALMASQLGVEGAQIQLAGIEAQMKELQLKQLQGWQGMMDMLAKRFGGGAPGAAPAPAGEAPKAPAAGGIKPGTVVSIGE